MLGEDAALYGEHALLKPALVGPETPWHQDEAFRSPDFVYNELSIWLALQPATLENGCMQFIPGSNKGEVLEHDPMASERRQTEGNEQGSGSGGRRRDNAA